jgi:amino acid permease
MSNEKTFKEDYAATSIETLESVTDNSIVQQPHQLSRGLKARHIQMIALGGTIGKLIHIK